MRQEILGEAVLPTDQEAWQLWAARYNGFGKQAMDYGKKVLECRDEYLSVWGER